MRSTAVSGVMFLAGVLVVAGWVAAAPAPAQQSDAKAATPTPAQTAVQLRARMHKAIAELLEARAADKPDPQKIQALTEQVQKLRAELAGLAPETTWAPGWRCPWGGPGRGAGFGPGGAWGPRGPGFGPGAGRGGFGPGPGRGYGVGPGRGAAVGPGYGRGAGLGAGAGWGPQFIDANRDGVCDRYQLRRAQQ